MKVMSSEEKIQYIGAYTYINSTLKYDLELIDDTFILQDKKTKRTIYSTKNLNNLKNYFNSCGKYWSDGLMLTMAKHALKLYFLDCNIIAEETKDYIDLKKDFKFLTRIYTDGVSLEHSFIKYGILGYDFSVEKVKNYICPNCNALFHSLKKTKNAIIFTCSNCHKKHIEVL